MICRLVLYNIWNVPVSPESQEGHDGIYGFFVLQSPHLIENLILEPEETSKGGPLAAIDGLMHLLSRCVTR